MKAPWLDPHRGREYDLMRLGSKKLAYFFDEANLHVNDDFFVVEPYSLGTGKRFLVYRRQDQIFAENFKQTNVLFFAGNMIKIICHAIRGTLLGYDPADIATFIKKRGRESIL